MPPVRRDARYQRRILRQRLEPDSRRKIKVSACGASQQSPAAPARSSSATRPSSAATWRERRCDLSIASVRCSSSGRGPRRISGPGVRRIGGSGALGSPVMPGRRPWLRRGPQHRRHRPCPQRRHGLPPFPHRRVRSQGAQFALPQVDPIARQRAGVRRRGFRRVPCLAPGLASRIVRLGVHCHTAFSLLAARTIGAAARWLNAYTPAGCSRPQTPLSFASWTR